MQKFPYIVEEIQSLSAQKFDIIIDEANSSQTGKSAAKMSASLSKKDSEVEEATEDKIIRIIESQKPYPNANYYAFTTTPKNKTLELFGVKIQQMENFIRSIVIRQSRQLRKDLF